VRYVKNGTSPQLKEGMTMKTRSWFYLLVAAFLALILGVGAACSGSSSDTATTDSADTDAVEHVHADGAAADVHPDGDADAADDHAEGDAHGHDDAADADQTVVHTILDEWSVAVGHDGEADLTVPAGPVTFEVHNEGQTVHELVIVKTDQPADALPVSNGTVDLAAAGEVVDRTSQFGSGEMELLTVNLEPGTYVLLCNIPGHYQQGMFAQVTVE
jgi:uncharacterized cupredoxin-like copper-binding protein